MCEIGFCKEVQKVIMDFMDFIPFSKLSIKRPLTATIFQETPLAELPPI